jgi:hypothetical protein
MPGPRDVDDRPNKRMRIVLVGQILLRFLSGPPLEHALVLVLLLTLIVTLYDQYRTIYLARFATTA